MRRDLCRMMRSSHYQTYVDVLVGTYMGEDDRITLRTTCVLVEFPSEPVSELREMLTRTSEVRRPQENDSYGKTVMEFLSRQHPAHLVQEIVKLKVVLQDVDRILSDLEVGTRGAAHKLMTLRSLKNPDVHTGRTTIKTSILYRIMRTPMTPRDRITFWAGSSIMYQLEDLLSLHLTTNDLALVKLTVARLAEDPIVIPWP